MEGNGGNERYGMIGRANVENWINQGYILREDLGDVLACKT